MKRRIACLAAALLVHTAAAHAGAAAAPEWAVGAQYDTTHVFVPAADFDAFVAAFTGTFGGQPSKRITATITPTPSSAQLQYVWTPAGTLSTFAFTTPVPYPFGLERTGYLVSDLDQALAAARKAGADVIVAPFKDPIGRDAIIQWPGGVDMQLYWHFTPPHYDPLAHIPDNRVYVSPDRANVFVRDFLRFAHGRIVSDQLRADAAEIGLPGQTYRRIRLESGFGKMQVMVTDGHLPYPFGREVTGYEVASLTATLDKAKANGARLLYGPVAADGRDTAVLQFPGGYIAEVHDLKAH